MRNVILVATLSALAAPSLVSAADSYLVDPAHTSIGFSVKHLIVTTVRGRITDFDAELMVDESDLTKSTLNVTIQAGSITTENEKRDGHLKSDDFFNVETYPTITFKSTKIEKKEDVYLVSGDLTIRDVTKPFTLTATLLGPMPAGGGGKKIALSAEGKLNRQDFGVKWNRDLDNGGVMVSNDVNVEVGAEFVLPGAEKK